MGFCLLVLELKQVFGVLNEFGSSELECATIFKTDISIKNDKPSAPAVIKARHTEPGVCKHGYALKAGSGGVHLAVCQKLCFSVCICCRRKSV